jgi:hypothetical protein
MTARFVDFEMYLDRFRLWTLPKKMSDTKPAASCSWEGSKCVFKRVAPSVAIKKQKTMNAIKRFRKKSLAPSLASRSALSQ